MFCVLFAERAILGKSKPVRVVTLILVTVVIAVFAFCAFKSYLSPDLCFHSGKLRTKKLHLREGVNRV